jgi:hypothetical protein
MNQQQCLNHSGLEEAIETLKETDREQWKVINGMRAWVITGMCSLLAQCVAILGAIVFKKMGLL